MNGKMDEKEVIGVIVSVVGFVVLLASWSSYSLLGIAVGIILIFLGAGIAALKIR